MESDQENVLKQAVQATLRRIDYDLARVSWKSRETLKHIREKFLDTEFGVRNLTESDSYRLEDFRAELGVSPMRYVSSARLETAARLLRDTSISVNEVSRLSGYAEIAGFRAAFKRWFGILPSEYRRSALLVATEFGWPDKMELASILFWEELDRGTFEKTKLGQLHTWFSSLYGLPRSWQQENLLVEFFHHLGEMSLVEGRRDRQRGVDLAKIALEFLDINAEVLGEAGFVLKSLGWARLANARRLALDFPGAEKDFKSSEVIWHEVSHLQEPRAEAEILALKATFLHFQRKCTQARETLDAAVRCCNEASDPKLLSKIMVQSARSSNYVGQHLEAIKELREALKLLESEDAYLKKVVHGNLGASYVWAKRPDEALEALATAACSCDSHADPLGHNLLLWLEGLARRQKGELGAAESLLREARLGLIEHCERGYVAVIAVDLALLCRETDRSAEALSLASEAIPILQAFDLPEVLEAVKLLTEGIVANALSTGTLEKAQTCLWHLYRDPALPLASSSLLSSPA